MLLTFREAATDLRSIVHLARRPLKRLSARRTTNLRRIFCERTPRASNVSLSNGTQIWRLAIPLTSVSAGDFPCSQRSQRTLPAAAARRGERGRPIACRYALSFPKSRETDWWNARYFPSAMEKNRKRMIQMGNQRLDHELFLA